jgi:hypothetical protein
LQSALQKEIGVAFKVWQLVKTAEISITELNEFDLKVEVYVEIEALKGAKNYKARVMRYDYLEVVPSKIGWNEGSEQAADKTQMTAIHCIAVIDDMYDGLTMRAESEDAFLDIVIGRIRDQLGL